jgi:hypothetical protein
MQNIFNPSTNERSVEIAKLNSHSSSSGLIDKLNGDQVMRRYQARDQERQSSRSQTKTYQSLDYQHPDKAKLQTPTGNKLLIEENEEKGVEKQKQLKNLSNFLKSQIAKKLKTLHEEKNSEKK